MVTGSSYYLGAGRREGFVSPPSSAAARQSPADRHVVKPLLQARVLCCRFASEPVCGEPSKCACSIAQRLWQSRKAPLARMASISAFWNSTGC